MILYMIYIYLSIDKQIYLKGKALKLFVPSCSLSCNNLGMVQYLNLFFGEMNQKLFSVSNIGFLVT